MCVPIAGFFCSISCPTASRRLSLFLRPTLLYSDQRLRDRSASLNAPAMGERRNIDMDAKSKKRTHSSLYTRRKSVTACSYDGAGRKRRKTIPITSFHSNKRKYAPTSVSSNFRTICELDILLRKVNMVRESERSELLNTMQYNLNAICACISMKLKFISVLQAQSKDFDYSKEKFNDNHSIMISEILENRKLLIRASHLLSQMEVVLSYRYLVKNVELPKNTQWLAEIVPSMSDRQFKLHVRVDRRCFSILLFILE